ncbi:MAG: proline dehydrogenase family protein, partial [Acidimicrobiia bacterium]
MADAARTHDQLVAEAVALAGTFLDRAAEVSTAAEKRRNRQQAAIASDPGSTDFLVALTDEVLRIEDDAIAGAGLARVLRRGIPSFVGPVDRAQLWIGGKLAGRLPRAVVPLARRRMRREFDPVVLDDAPSAISAAVRSAGPLPLNVNPLGEAVLSDAEADRRFAAALDLLHLDDVDYLSVKATAICAHLDVLDFDHSVARLADRFGLLLDAAESGAKFVNLDMEEFATLDLSVAGFRRALDARPSARAGIVVQAYLPDAVRVVDELLEWAAQRHEVGGVAPKIRLVKGANLAMEHVEAELHGWRSAPLTTKADVDANYKR